MVAMPVPSMHFELSDGFERRPPDILLATISCPGRFTREKIA
jgi:hypothetical protein